MVKYQQAALDATFAALADPTRRAILARLARGEHRVTELAAPFRMSLPAVSKHLRVLERARLVRRERDGRVHRMSLAPLPLQGAADWIDFYRKFWEEQLHSLARYFEELNQEKETPCTPPQPPAPRSSKSAARSRRRRNRSSGPGSSRNE